MSVIRYDMIRYGTVWYDSSRSSSSEKKRTDPLFETASNLKDRLLRYIVIVLT
jgi:hypothetical protein